MRDIVTFVAANYSRMVLAMIVSAFLSGLVPPFALVSGGLPTLITLHFGWRRSISAVAGALIVAAILTLVATLVGWNIGYAALIWILFTQWLPAILFAETLRRLRSLTHFMYIFTLVGVVLFFVTITFFPDIDSYWREIYAEIGLSLANDEGLPLPELLDYFFSIFTGVVISSFLMMWSLMLLLGRWWQLLLDSPGSFSDEFTRISIGKKYSLGVIALLCVWLVTEAPIVMQLCVIMVIPALVLHGVASWHFLLGQCQSRIGHTLFYVSLTLFIVAPWLMLILVVTSVAESFLRLREKFSRV